MDKLIFKDEFIPVKEEAVRSILDYDIEIYSLSAEDQQYSALNMNYSVAGFQIVLARKRVTATRVSTAAMGMATKRLTVDKVKPLAASQRLGCFSGSQNTPDILNTDLRPEIVSLHFENI